MHFGGLDFDLKNVFISRSAETVSLDVAPIGSWGFFISHL